MGYLIPKDRESERIVAIEKRIKEEWEKLYYPEFQRAFTTVRQATWYKYLQYQKERGWIQDFYPLSKITRREGKVRHHEYVYYADFEVEYSFGNVLVELFWGKISSTFVNFIRKNNLKVMVVDINMSHEVVEAYQDVIDFSHKPLEVKDINSKKYYTHFR